MIETDEVPQYRGTAATIIYYTRHAPPRRLMVHIILMVSYCSAHLWGRVEYGAHEGTRYLPSLDFGAQAEIYDFDDGHERRVLVKAVLHLKIPVLGVDMRMARNDMVG